MDRDEALAHFQAITGMHDMEECRACLEAHSWNLDEAVNSALAHHDAPMAQHYGQGRNESAAFGAANARGRDNIDAPPPGPAPESRGLFHSMTGVPLWNVVSSVVRIASCKPTQICVVLFQEYPADTSFAISGHHPSRDREHSYSASAARDSAVCGPT